MLTLLPISILNAFVLASSLAAHVLCLSSLIANPIQSSYLFAPSKINYEHDLKRDY